MDTDDLDLDSPAARYLELADALVHNLNLAALAAVVDCLKTCIEDGKRLEDVGRDDEVRGRLGDGAEGREDEVLRAWKVKPK